MREENEAIAELIGALHRLVNVLEEFVQSSEGEEPLPTEKTEASTLEEVRAVLAKLSVAGRTRCRRQGTDCQIRCRQTQRACAGALCGTLEGG